MDCCVCVLVPKPFLAPLAQGALFVHPTDDILRPLSERQRHASSFAARHIRCEPCTDGHWADRRIDRVRTIGIATAI